MWSSQVSGHRRSEPNLGSDNRQCVPVCLTGRWPSTHTQAYMYSLTKSHTCTHMCTHACTCTCTKRGTQVSHITWGSWEKSCSLSHTCEHMLWLTHVFMVTHTVHKYVLAARTLAVRHIFPFTTHTHTQAWACTPVFAASLTQRLLCHFHFTVYYHVRCLCIQQQVVKYICNSMPCFCHLVKLW